MDVIGPLFFCLILPVAWSVIMFTLGRWSAGHRISIQRREQVNGNGGASPYYDNFGSEA